MEERLKELRKTLNLTQQEFADKIGVKRNTIAQYESGRNAPIDAVVTLICRTYGVNETWLRTGEGEMFISRGRSEAIAQEINRFIPIIVMVLGGLIAMWSEWTCSPDVIARGFVSGLASTGAYEAIDQLRLRGYEKKVEGMATDPYELVGAEEDGD